MEHSGKVMCRTFATVEAKVFEIRVHILAFATFLTLEALGDRQSSGFNALILAYSRARTFPPLVIGRGFSRVNTDTTWHDFIGANPIATETISMTTTREILALSHINHLPFIVSVAHSATPIA
jgi:hypothetical protein